MGFRSRSYRTRIIINSAVGAIRLPQYPSIMAKKVKSIFKVIEATPQEFLSVGLGGSNNIKVSVIKEGPLEGLSHIEIEGGEFLVCDLCNEQLLQEPVCYYIAVLNQIMCKKCFERHIANAKYYQEDKPYESRNYYGMLARIEEAGLWKVSDKEGNVLSKGSKVIWTDPETGESAEYEVYDEPSEGIVKLSNAHGDCEALPEECVIIK